MEPGQVSSVIWLSLKIFILLGIGVYVAFASIILRQEQLMSDVLEESFEPVLRLITLIHLVAAIAVFLIALIVL